MSDPSKQQIETALAAATQARNALRGAILGGFGMLDPQWDPPTVEAVVADLQAAIDALN
jgi:hypothetical protein